MYPRILLAGLLLVGAAVHIYFSLVLAQANALGSQDAIEPLEAAHRLAPSNAAYLARLAEIDPDRGPAWVDAALALHPRASVLWIEKGVSQEVQGDAAAAERSFLEAARLDHQYATRWTLTAFYFRQQNKEKFAEWARQALDLLYLKDPQPILQMALALGFSTAEVRERLLPERAPVYRAFLVECVRRQDYGEAARAAAKLVAISPGDVEIERQYDLNAVLSAVDALHAAGETAAAVATWNAVTAAKWIPQQPIEAKRLVANPEFRYEFQKRGFDWRPRGVDGASLWRRQGSGGEMHVELTGRQPQRCVLLVLPVPLEPGRRYSLRVKSDAEGLRGAKGLSWRIGDQEWDAGAGNLAVTFVAPTNAPNPTNAHVPAAGPAGAPPGAAAAPPVAGKPAGSTLVLQYARALGTKRAEGALVVREVTISAEAAQETSGVEGKGQ